ncbi:MAG: hypothetical protein WCI11_04805 [Candidatus Methylumidiphilus sp.]
MTHFSIDCGDWESALHETAEIRETSTMLKMHLGNAVITRNEDMWSKTVRDKVRLSAYPLALWFASSWWRLRWESLPKCTPSHSWRMSHELAAAGHGYLWPKMLFASDGESIQIWAVQSSPNPNIAVRYLCDASDVISGLQFEHSIDRFMDSVVARLDSVGLGKTTLFELWTEICAEREDTDISAYRRLEAMLGFDPDECPEELHSQFSDLIPKAGVDAVAEIAPVCASPNPQAVLKEITEFAASRGYEGQVDISIDIDANDSEAPWQRGRKLAQKIRSLAKLNGDAVDDTILCDLLNLTKDAITDYPSSTAPLGIAVRESCTRSKFLLSKRHRTGRRFELARLLCEHLVDKQNNVWLPATQAKTARQKVQRAFAAEFLCPIENLKERLNGNFSEDAIEDVAEQFGVSPKAVETQLVNHGILSNDRLAFPYFVSTFNHWNVCFCN